jgi:hypothetical protein
MIPGLVILAAYFGFVFTLAACMRRARGNLNLEPPRREELRVEVVDWREFEAEFRQEYR